MPAGHGPYSINTVWPHSQLKDFPCSHEFRARARTAGLCRCHRRWWATPSEMTRLDKTSWVSRTTSQKANTKKKNRSSRCQESDNGRSTDQKRCVAGYGERRGCNVPTTCRSCFRLGRVSDTTPPSRPPVTLFARPPLITRGCSPGALRLERDRLSLQAVPAGAVELHLPGDRGAVK